jgi:PilZ domain-containing protein
MTAVNQWKSWVRRIGHPDKPRAERRIPLGFVAWQANNPASKRSTVKDISSSGLYLHTQERWPVGEVIPLTIEVEGWLEKGVHQQIAVQTLVVRTDEDGVGLSFVLPEGFDPELWKVLVTDSAVLTDPKDLLYALKMMRTALFLYRLCHAEANEAILLLGEELDEPRTENALEIALGAEKLLALETDADKMRAHPGIVASIFKYGSWALDDLTKQLWIGLFVTSCHRDTFDESYSVFVDLLVNLTPTQSLILVTACKKIMDLMADSNIRPSTRIIFTPEEMTQLTGIYDPARVAVETAYLFNPGLIEKVFDFTSYLPTEKFDITPSRLGLELYKRCKGERIVAPPPLDKSETQDKSGARELI